MKKPTLRELIFMSLCCDLGLLAKKLVSPAANILTEILHIPGGIATSFSLLFIVICAYIVSFRGCASLISAVQALLAVFLGMTGSMGAMAPIAYLVPGIVIDLCFIAAKRITGRRRYGIFPAAVLASVAASSVANLLVFSLPLPVLLVYAFTAAASGAVCGLLAESLCMRLKKVLRLRPDESCPCRKDNCSASQKA